MTTKCSMCELPVKPDGTCPHCDGVCHRLTLLCPRCAMGAALNYLGVGPNSDDKWIPDAKA